MNEPTMQPTYPPTEAKARPAPRQPLKDLAVPPELARTIERYCEDQRIQEVGYQNWVAEELKLQYYYGGKDVACIDTPEGRCVLAVGTPVIENLSKILLSLPLDERRKVAIVSPEPWEERMVSIPSAVIDEA
jgi:hypothetical protein